MTIKDLQYTLYYTPYFNQQSCITCVWHFQNNVKIQSLPGRRDVTRSCDSPALQTIAHISDTSVWLSGKAKAAPDSGHYVRSGPRLDNVSLSQHTTTTSVNRPVSAWLSIQHPLPPSHKQHTKGMYIQKLSEIQQRCPSQENDAGTLMLFQQLLTTKGTEIYSDFSK